MKQEMFGHEELFEKCDKTFPKIFLWENYYYQRFGDLPEKWSLQPKSE